MPMAACQTHLRRHSFSSARCTLSCLPLPSDFLVHWMGRKNKAMRKRPMSQTLHCCKQLRLLLIKDANAFRAKLAAEPLEGVRARVDRDHRWSWRVETAQGALAFQPPARHPAPRRSITRRPVRWGPGQAAESPLGDEIRPEMSTRFRNSHGVISP